MITLTITTKGGTTLTLNIPEDGTSVTMASNSASNATSAVETPDGGDHGAEGGKLSDSEVVEVSSDELFVDEPGSNELTSREKIYAGGGVQEGEVGEGGIGSVREREGEEGEGGRGGTMTFSMNDEQVRLNELNSENLPRFKWPTIGGSAYKMPSTFRDILISRYGEKPVIQGCKDAYIWLVACPTRRKTTRGMGKFISGWLAREAEKVPKFPKYNYQSAHQIQQKGGLLSESRNTVTSW